MIIKSFEIQKNLNNLLKYNLFLLYGENEGLKKDIKKLIKKKINQNNENIEMLSFFEDEIINNDENLFNSIYSGSLFSNKKIITINNATDKIIKQVESISDKPVENISIIIYASLLDKKSKLRNFSEKNKKVICVPCYLDNDKDLQIIAHKILQEEKLTLSSESINLLIEKSNSDRGNLKNEIEKIKSYALNKKKIGVEEIKSIINFSGEYKSDSLVNECLCGNILQYKKILSELYVNTINQIFLLRILSNKIQRLVKMKTLENNYKDIDNLIKSAKPPIFWKEQPVVKKQLSIWHLNDLKKAIYEISNVELLCKKNPQISKIIFFNFFNKLCKKASNYS